MVIGGDGGGGVEARVPFLSCVTHQAAPLQRVAPRFGKDVSPMSCGVFVRDQKPSNMGTAAGFDAMHDGDAVMNGHFEGSRAGALQGFD